MSDVELQPEERDIREKKHKKSKKSKRRDDDLNIDDDPEIQKLLNDIAETKKLAKENEKEKKKDDGAERKRILKEQQKQSADYEIEQRN